MEEEEEFDDEADDGRGLSTEQVCTTETTCGLLIVPAYALHHNVNSTQVTQLMDMLCNETDVAEIDLEVEYMDTATKTGASMPS